MISVDTLFRHAGVQLQGGVPWGTVVPLREPGVYVVATTPNPEDSIGLEECPLDHSALENLLDARPEVTIDGAPADAANLARRLRAMWVRKQPIIYIGLATLSVQTRVGQFYSTAIGARAPHAGGWPIKMLQVRDLWVHYAASPDPDATERAMIETFMDSVQPETRRYLIDPSLPLPYANLVVPHGARKKHGLAGMKAARHTAGRARQRPMPEARPSANDHPSNPQMTLGKLGLTQNVTAKDIDTGMLRVPKESKRMFPPEPAKIVVWLKGISYTAIWRPGLGSDRERSGTIRIGRGALDGVLPIGGPRRILRLEDGYHIN